MDRRYIYLTIIIAASITVVTVYRDARELFWITSQQISDTDHRVQLRGETYTLRYVPKKNITPRYGLARIEFGTKFALVRADLPARVQRFVMFHEIYHLQDKKYQGTFLRELHATLGALPYEPLGFVQTVSMTLTDPERLEHYWQLIFLA